jgi:UDPglucose 6-dehydrogenase
MKITIVGHGYVGLVTAVVFADLGNSVWVIGRDPKKVDQLNSGKPTFYEPGLEEMLKRNLDAGRVKFTLKYDEAIASSEIAFICVGTPPKENGEADLTNVLKVAGEIGKYIKKYIVIACKSTVPVGTNYKIQKLLVEKGKVDKSKFDIASCPEFLREGTALGDTLHPDRVVIGSDTAKARKVLLDFHRPIGGRRVLTNIPTAEMIKYASNALLATKISFANMMAFLSEKVGADVENVLIGVGLDRRLGRSFLYPGVGYGGSCLPKDVKALIKVGEFNGEDMGILKEVEEVNNDASRRFAQKVIKVLGASKSKKTIGVLGLAFKPDTDDMREAPSIKILRTLSKQFPGLTIKAYDPIVKNIPDKNLTHVLYSESAYDAAADTDLVIVLTEWNEFRQLDLEKLAKLMKKPVMIDGRNIFDLEEIKKHGITYYGVGRN